MSDPYPTEIDLHRKSRVLSITFGDGNRFDLPCEYLRVYSKAADSTALRDPVVGKERVGIDKIEPLGQYALRLFFDDGHDTGIYAFTTLYDLGLNQAENWAAYLRRLQTLGVERQPIDDGEIAVKVLVFAWLAQLLETDAETVRLPQGRHTVADALAALRTRPGRWGELIRDDQLRVTVNRQFAESFTRLEHGDELAVVPKSPAALD